MALPVAPVHRAAIRSALTAALQALPLLVSSPADLAPSILHGLERPAAMPALVVPQVALARVLALALGPDSPAHHAQAASVAHRAQAQAARRPRVKRPVRHALLQEDAADARSIPRRRKAP